MCVSPLMCIDVLASVKSETSRVAEGIENKINSCLADVHGTDASDVIDVIRKAITDNDDDGNRYVSRHFLTFCSAV